MKKATVEPSCTGQFSQLFLDYLAQKPELKPFYSFFPSLENFSSLIQQKNFSQDKRDVLADVLHRQYQGIATSELTLSQIESLRSKKTFTVITGHQLNLFTGPLYFIYKIVTTINLAEQLKKAYPEYHFVPVYWLASEDHDFDEINYFKLDGKKYQWNSDQTGSVGDFQLDETFKNFFKTVSHFAPEFFKDAYLGSQTLAEAGRKYVHHLFGEKGLLIVDGKEASLRSFFHKVIVDDLTNHTAYQKSTEQTAKLETLGYKSQIFPREINFFYTDKGLRERIEQVEDFYHVLNTDLKFTQEEILRVVAESPEKFSPNVVLRPLYQEMILPNLAYIGGPAEMVYWLQLKTVFDHFEEAFPAVMPRNFAAVLDAKIIKKKEKLGLSEADLFQSVIDWKKQYILNHAQTDIFLEKERAELKTIFEQARDTAVTLDQTLHASFEAARVRALKIMDQMSTKLRKAEERKHAQEIRMREDIAAHMYPGGTPQERLENFLKFYLGDDTFIEQLFDTFDPLDFKFIVLSQDGDEG
ncbi:bacillithiol biosynthesis cysteine-adding enzyme BshC [Mongoliitalea daihaiensis]|uniref:bacillithiol biosynthesis cysteine-adding enzyme BshC n=1 Tax=Mongoliitalea daihaiensis TaxID=2782006 RepID=UPI001F43E00F|nr:bacillithiol biosynthesis cysteine-adding enzyme BshC [Mongoliitalea daihaiensis]UJP66494.1 bacillithiol biosynthesis cysteine-adding enzyme BshC [Mongoliitalea daihaiensis]